MKPIDVQIVGVTLKKLLESQSFSICGIDDMLKFTGRLIGTEDYRRMRALHCVNYRDMTPAVRSWLVNTLHEVFTEDDASGMWSQFLKLDRDKSIQTLPQHNE